MILALIQVKPAAANPAAVAVIGALMVAFGLYMVYEIWRWFAGNRSQLTPGQFRRRVVGGILLEIDLALWLLADFIMPGRSPREKLLYFLFGLLFLIVPMLLAVREAAFVARQYSRWRSDLFRNMAQEERERVRGAGD